MITTTEIVRANTSTGSASLGDGNELFGHFAVFDSWTKIDNYWEGTFMERIAPGAFAATLAERADKIRILYQHGQDPVVGMKPIAVPRSIVEDATGAAYTADMLDATYAQDLKPAIAMGQMGASFRGTVVGETWMTPGAPTEWNPSMMEERTITAIDLIEAGPVTFGAYESATAGMRSMTGEYRQALTDDTLFIARLTERVGAKVVEQMIEEARAAGGPRISKKSNTEHDAPDGTAGHDPTAVLLLAETFRHRTPGGNHASIGHAGGAAG